MARYSGLHPGVPSYFRRRILCALARVAPAVKATITVYPSSTQNLPHDGSGPLLLADIHVPGDDHGPLWDHAKRFLAESG